MGQHKVTNQKITTVQSIFSAENTMKVFGAVVVALFALCAVTSAFEEQGPVCINENQCAEYPDTPLCRRAGLNATDDKRCLECDPAVSAQGNPYASFCSPGDFCVRRDFLNHPVYGSFKMGECVDLDDPIGEVCDPDVNAGNVELGENDKFFCGFVSEWNDAGRPEANAVQWEGACINRECYACQDGQGSITADKVCASRSLAGAGASVYSYRGPGSILTFKQNTVAQLLLATTIFTALIMCCNCCLVFRSKLPF